MILTIEEYLREPGFLGVSLSDTFQDLRVKFLARDIKFPGIVEYTKTRLRPYCGMNKNIDPVPTQSFKFSLETNRILFAAISIREYSRQVIPQIISSIGDDQCHVITHLKGLDTALPNTVGVLSWRDIPGPDLKIWRKEFQQVYPQWNERLRELKRKFKLTSYALSMIRFALISASQRIIRYGVFLDRLKPRAILVDYDRNSRVACLVLAARKRGIPSMTLVHGAVYGPYNFTPIIADIVLTWGEHQRDQFIAHKIPPEKIEIVGFQRIADDTPVDPMVIRSRFDISDDSLVVMFASNPIELNARIQNVVLFCQAATAISDVAGIVRLHPSESLESYDAISKQFPQIFFTDNKDLSAAEALTLAEVVVAHSSGFGGEALAKGRYAIVLDAVDVPIGPGEDLIKWGNAPCAKNAMELESILLGIKNDSEFRRKLKSGGENYYRRMFAAVGNGACRNIAASVLKHALPKDNKSQIP